MRNICTNVDMNKSREGKKQLYAIFCMNILQTVTGLFKILYSDRLKTFILTVEPIRARIYEISWRRPLTLSLYAGCPQKTSRIFRKDWVVFTKLFLNYMKLIVYPRHVI